MTRKLSKNNSYQALKPKVIKNDNFPSDKEIEEITKRVSAPNYPYVNYILPDNASSAEKVKYSLCQNISRYKRENNISETKLIKILGVNKDKLTDILFSKIYNLNLEELIIYTNNLHIPFEITIKSNSTTPREIKIANSQNIRDNKRIRI